MLITALNVAGVILLILAACLFLGLFGVGTATPVGLLVGGIICLVVAYMLSHRTV